MWDLCSIICKSSEPAVERQVEDVPCLNAGFLNIANEEQERYIQDDSNTKHAPWHAVSRVVADA